jgi:hypothetical protein
MPRAPGALGVIHMERKPSRVDSFLDREEELDCAGELIRLSRSPRFAGPPIDGLADEVVCADNQRLAEELNAEYASLCDLMGTLSKSS